AHALEVVHALIGARLLIPGEAAFNSEVKPLEHAILTRDEAQLAAALDETRDVADPALFVAVSEVLADAVEWPSGLERLLAAGADPNRPNAFGKTPLMVAAH